MNEPVKEKESRVAAIDENVNYGVYVWVLPNGSSFEDNEGNVLNIPSMRYDLKKISILTKAAKYWGAEGGYAKFIPGVGRVSNSEYEEDLDRMRNGLTPYGDTGAWRESWAADAKRR